jgi:ABC-2 type transport system ATP-binding protein
MRVDFDEVTKSFGDHVVLDGLAFAVEPGSIVLLLGGNGSGKSTALRVLLGLVRPDGGAATLDGARYAEVPNGPRRVGVALGTGTVDAELSAASLLRLRARIVGASDADVAAALHAYGLHAARRRRLRRLSTGMQARALLAVAMLGRPDLVVLDEPFANLDADGRDHLVSELRALRSRGGSALVTSHQRETYDVGDRWIDVFNGADVRPRPRRRPALVASGRERP